MDDTQLVSGAVNFINKTEKMLDDFEKDDARWKFLGKKLGFDF